MMDRAIIIISLPMHYGLKNREDIDKKLTEIIK